MFVSSAKVSFKVNTGACSTQLEAFCLFVATMLRVIQLLPTPESSKKMYLFTCINHPFAHGILRFGCSCKTGEEKKCINEDSKIIFSDIRLDYS